MIGEKIEELNLEFYCKIAEFTFQHAAQKKSEFSHTSGKYDEIWQKRLTTFGLNFDIRAVQNDVDILFDFLFA